MRFNKLKIGLKNSNKQQVFYKEILGFTVSTNEASEIVIKAGATQFILSKQIIAPHLYHFAFLIPTGSLESAIEYIESRSIDLLPFQGEKIIHFDTGRSIYFFDPDGNIAEFIERPLLNYPTKKKFEIDDIICVNEIGLPVDQPLVVSGELMNKHGIQPINHKNWNDNFCWVGDHEGAVIVVKEGRHWLPTQISGVLNDFELHYTGFNKNLLALKVENGQITSSNF
ncbi:hypothetical protein SAMN04488029_2490 [Reichenbachiella faecimaris]|uniref:VOC domain-containing protein n=1 Tax=Reichenbachiella faecimaris TaxID=692418 RepID=A0A1W2GFG9_REIFA|nr:hypothetical protein [Reichenbachiella faecimaris]SMD35387.1 hypothetical protein SAMN04488029_2490 [Reichenbachiella faecimaris]